MINDTESFKKMMEWASKDTKVKKLSLSVSNNLLTLSCFMHDGTMVEGYGKTLSDTIENYRTSLRGTECIQKILS